MKQKFFVLSLIGLTLGFNLNLKILQSESQRRILVAPPGHLDKFSFGYEEVVADMLWVRLLGDIDVCEQSNQQNYEAPINTGHADALSLIIARPTKAALCEKGWAFQMLDAITNLAPRNYLPYSIGAPILSVISDDREGARLLFEKGVKRFPAHWQLSYRAAYHYLFEVRDLNRAAELLTKAADAGAPSWTRILAARLYTREGQYAMGKAVLDDYIAENPNSQFAEQAKKRLKQLYEEYEKSEAKKESPTSVN